ncbi:unnamed protein product [Prunus armeniaca]|uniref:Uncharacterized protein n=1 Tax=Prunus armeniaca TaxID=36596 RepID=A0A6J5WLB0_PRUAR|nr:unnamed protein product [Prunus armeniaca]
MRVSNTFGWFSGCRLWLLAFAACLVLLGALSRSSHKVFSMEGSKYQLSMKTPLKGSGYPPVFAYWICGTNGESEKILRLLKAIYHPRNQYLLQLDAGSSDYDRGQLALYVQSEKVFQAFGNVNVVGKSYALNQMGSSALAATLHAAALLDDPIKKHGFRKWIQNPEAASRSRIQSKSINTRPALSSQEHPS